MKNLLILIVFPLLILSCSVDNKNSSDNQDISSSPERKESSSDAQSIDYDVEERLEELNIQLATPNPPTANYLKSRRTGNLIFLSGHGPDKPEGGQVTGKLGSDLTVEEGKEAARLVGISLLSSLKVEIGDLNKVKRLVRAHGMVNAIPSFTQHSQVINGFSDLMVEVFGENGKHARAAIGMSSLPSNIAVEIDLIVEIEE